MEQSQLIQLHHNQQLKEEVYNKLLRTQGEMTLFGLYVAQMRLMQSISRQQYDQQLVINARLQVQQLPDQLGSEITIWDVERQDFYQDQQYQQQQALLGCLQRDCVKPLIRLMQDQYASQIQLAVCIPLAGGNIAMQDCCYCWVAIYGRVHQQQAIVRLCELYDIRLVGREHAVAQFSSWPPAAVVSSSSSGYGTTGSQSVNGGGGGALALQSGLQQQQRKVTEQVMLDTLKNLISEEDIEEARQPERLCSTLFPHQRMALTFMLGREQQGGNSVVKSFYSKVTDGYKCVVDQSFVTRLPGECQGGILSDDMGLGKSLDVVSLILAAPYKQDGEYGGGGDDDGEFLTDGVVRDGVVACKTTLIVCPPSVISSWEEQCTVHVSKDRPLRILVYHGSSRTTDAGVLADYDVVLTTYSIVAMEYKKEFGSRQKKNKKTVKKRRVDVTPYGNTSQQTLQSSYYSSTDYMGMSASQSSAYSHGNGYNIGNYDRAPSSLSMTSSQVITISDNDGESDGDLDSGLDAYFNNDVAPKLNSSVVYKSPLYRLQFHRIVLDEAHFIKDAGTQAAQAVSVLHAARRWCLTGTPIVNKMEDLFSLVKFLRVEPFCSRQTWQSRFAKSITNTQTYSTPAMLKRSEESLVMLRTLMKCLMLRRTKTTKINGKPIINIPPKNDYVVDIEFSPQERQLYDTIADWGRRLFSKYEAANTVLKNYTQILEIFLRLRQICTHSSMCKDKLEHMIQSDGSTFTKTEAKNLLDTLTDGGDDMCVSCQQYVSEMEDKKCAITQCRHLLCHLCFAMQKSKQLPCGMCRMPIDFGKAFVLNAHAPDVDSPAAHSSMPFTNAADALAGKLNQSLIGNAHVLSADSLSSKFKYLVGDLLKNKDVKSVVFSQWTSCLTLLEIQLKRYNIKFVRLDGGMSLIQRQLSLKTFKEDESIQLLIMSLKAGGVGLNLTCASRVYLLDLWWNASAEQQAVDRVHRLGQKSPVTCVRIVVKNSIEDNVLALQRKKTAIMNMAMSDRAAGGDYTGRERRELRAQDVQQQKQDRIQDLKSLFGAVK